MLDQVTDEAVRHLARFQGLAGRGHSATGVVAKNHHDGGFKLLYRVLQRAERGVLQDVAGGAHHEGVAQAQVKNNFRRKTRVTATKDGSEGELTRSKVGTADGVLVGVLVATLNETSVAVLQMLPRLCGGRLNLVGLLSHGVFS